MGNAIIYPGGACYGPLDGHIGDDCTIYLEFYCDMSDFEFPTQCVSFEVDGPNGAGTYCGLYFEFEKQPVVPPSAGPGENTCAYDFIWDLDVDKLASCLDLFTCDDLIGTGLITVEGCAIAHVCTELWDGSLVLPQYVHDITGYILSPAPTGAIATGDRLLILDLYKYAAEFGYTCGHLERYDPTNPTHVYITVIIPVCEWLEDCGVYPFDNIIGGDAISVDPWSYGIYIDHDKFGAWSGDPYATLNEFDGITPFTGGLIFHYVPRVFDINAWGHVLAITAEATQNLTITFLT
jgi:hypothetical protein